MSEPNSVVASSPPRVAAAPSSSAKSKTSPKKTIKKTTTDTKAAVIKKPASSAPASKTAPVSKPSTASKSNASASVDRPTTKKTQSKPSDPAPATTQAPALDSSSVVVVPIQMPVYDKPAPRPKPNRPPVEVKKPVNPQSFRDAITQLEKTLTQQDDELWTAQTRCDDLDYKNKNLQAIADKVEMADVLELALKNERDKSAALASDREDLRQKVLQQSKTINSLNAKVTEMDQKNIALESALESSRKMVQDLQTEISNLKSQHSNAIQESDKTHDEAIATLREAHDTRVTALRAELEALHTEHTELDQKYADLKRDDTILINTKDAEIASLKDALSIEKDRSSLFQANTVKHESDITKLTKENARLQGRIDVLENSMTTQLIDMESKSKDLERLKTQASEYGVRIEVLQQRLARAQEDLSKERAEYSQSIQKEMDKMRMKEDHINVLSHDKEAVLEHAITVKNRIIGEWEVKCERLNADLDIKIKEVESLKSSLNDANLKVDQVKSEKELAVKEAERSKARDLEQIQVKCNDTIRDAISGTEQTMIENKALIAERDVVARHNTELIDELNGYKEREIELKNKIEECNKNAKIQIESEKKKIKDLSAQYEADKIAMKESHATAVCNYEGKVSALETQLHVLLHREEENDQMNKAFEVTRLKALQAADAIMLEKKAGHGSRFR